MKKTAVLLQAKEGDMDAFNTLFSTFRAPLASYLYRLVINRTEVEDLIQDVFLKAFENLASFRGESSLKTWVFSIATNQAKNHLRARKRWRVDTHDVAKAKGHKTPAYWEALIGTHHAAPQGAYDLKEHIDFCFTCLAKTLPLDQQIALILKDVYGFKLKEMTTIMERPFGGVKYLLHEARKTMVTIFDHRCALVNKQGVCNQCSELSGLFNPKQNAQRELRHIEMAKEAANGCKDKERLYRLRAQLVQAIDPLNAQGTDLHEVIMLLCQQVNEAPDVG